MGFKKFRKNLGWGVVVIYTISGLVLLPIAFYYPNEAPTVNFLIWFLPWLIAFVYGLVFLVTWVLDKKSKNKEKTITVHSNTSIDISKITPEQISSISKLTPEQIIALFHGVQNDKGT